MPTPHPQRPPTPPVHRWRELFAGVALLLRWMAWVTSAPLPPAQPPRRPRRRDGFAADAEALTRDGRALRGDLQRATRAVQREAP